MKKFPNTVLFSKSHKKRVFKGKKAQQFFTFSTGIRLKRSVYLSFDQFEAMRKILVRNFRPRGPKETKNQALLQSRQQKSVHKMKGKKAKQKRSKIYLFLKEKKKKTPYRIRSHIYSPITKKPLQVRMGKGKGNPHTWVSPTPFSKVTLEIARKKLKMEKVKRFAMRASRMLPGKTKIVFKRQYLRKENYFISKNSPPNANLANGKLLHYPTALPLFKNHHYSDA